MTLASSLDAVDDDADCPAQRHVIMPLTDGWQIWQRTLPIAPLMVALIIWGLIPTVHHRFGGFLNPAVR